MANYNLNYLQKDELTYELLVRGEDATQDSVENLRKLLRKCQNVTPDSSKLNGKISIQSEFENITSKLEFVEILIEQLSEEISKLQVAKLNAKLNHLQLRLGNLTKCKLEDDSHKNRLKEMTTKLETLTNKFSSIRNKVPEEELKQFEEKLNLSFVEEEKEQEKFTESAKITSTPVIKEPTLSNVNMYIPSQEQMQNPVYLGPESSLFNKLPNPALTYLSKFKVCNGLDVSQLLQFLRNVHEIRTQTCLTENQIYEILPSYTVPPLLNKVIECKTNSKNLHELHTVILETYLPVTLREKLKQDLIFRPQKPNEPLSLYVNEIQINSHILLANLSEKDLVAFIKNGLNPEIRNKLVFENNPTSFKDLEQLCINVNNIQYNDYLRNQLFPVQTTHAKYLPQGNSSYSQTRPTTAFRNTVTADRTCFNCNRKGHLAKQCYRQNPKNL